MMPIIEKQRDTFRKPKRRELLAEALSMWEEPFPEREKLKRCQHAGMVPLEGKAAREVIGPMVPPERYVRTQDDEVVGSVSPRERYIMCPDCGLIMSNEEE